MDLLTFIAEIVKACAWPLVLLLVALIFRGELRKLLGRMRKGKVGSTEFEFEFEQEMKALVASAQGSTAIPVPPEQVELAVDNPRAAILEAWVKLEKAARHLAFEHQLIEPNQWHNISLITRALSNSGLVSNEDFSLFNELRNFRNYAVHELSFSPLADSVLSYTRLAAELEERFRNLTVVREKKAVVRS